MQISKRFLTRLKLHEQPAYRLSQAAGVDPTWLSKVINEILPVQTDEAKSKVEAVGRTLGLQPDECWEDVSDEG